MGRQKLDVSDKIGTYRGEFAVVVRTLSGEVISTYKDKNLVVSLGKKNMVDLLCAVASGRPISHMMFGTGGIVEGGNIRVPQTSDTGLTAPITTGANGGYFPVIASSEQEGSLYIAKFETTIDFGDLIANPINNISEAALNTGILGNIFAAKCFPGIPKTQQIAIDVTWKILF